MINEPSLLRRNRRLAGLAATVALHMALLLLWQMSRQHSAENGVPVERIQWVNVAPKKVVVKPARPPRLAAPIPASNRPMAKRAPAAQPAAPLPVQSPAPVAAPADMIAEVPAGRSRDEIMAQAHRDIGKISKELGKEFPAPKISKPRDTPQTRLEKGIELANELAPPKWYEAPKIKELVDSGSYGRRRYRVITANGTYCITYESNHAPDGIDVISKGMQQKLTSCPEHDLPPTKQKGLE